MAYKTAWKAAWEDYLALLTWQGGKVFAEDFANLKKLSLKSPEDIALAVSDTKTKRFLAANKNWWREAEETGKACAKKGYRLSHPGSADYPKPFLSFLNQPPLISYIGCLPDCAQFPPITFVGSRRANETVLNWMDFYLPQLIREKSLCAVSGGARGLDQKAHSLALRAGKPTLCFLPSGLDHFYPYSLRQWRKEILDQGGGFVSCFPPQAKMQKSFFHIRNQLMACYSLLTVILQAQIRSGTMLTAKKSLDYGTPVAALPGPPLSPQFTGNLQLLYDGAFLLRDGLDLAILIDSLLPISEKRHDSKKPANSLAAMDSP